MRRRDRRAKSYIAVVADPEGVTYRYLVHGSRQDVEKEARESARRSGTTFVAIEAAVDSGRTSRRRLLVAAITVALAGIVITGIVLVGETVSSAL